MPDTTTFNTPSTPKINWMYVGGGIVGFIALIYLLSKKTSTIGTTAAGASINAALGSIQEGQLNLQGAQSFAQTSLDTLTTGQNNLTNTIGGISTGVSGIQTDVTGIKSTVGDINAEQQALLDSLTQSRDTLAAALGNNSAQVVTVQNQINAVEQQMQAGFSGLGTQVGDIVTQLLASMPKNSPTGPDFGFLSGKLIYSIPDSTSYLVDSAGKLTNAGFWAHTHRPDLGYVETGSTLKQYSTSNFFL